MSDGCTGDAPCQWAHDLMFACHSQQERATKAERTFDELHSTIERLMAERDAAEARVTLLEGSLRKAAERLESRGHHFGAERARAALTALPQVPQSTASPDDQEGEKT